MDTTHNASRRQILVAGTLGSFILPARAEAMLALQAGAAIVGIVSGINGLLSAPDSRYELRQINKKLNAIIASQAAILEDLRALRVYIDQAFEVSWRNVYAREIAAYNDQLRDISEEPRLTDRVRREYEGLFVDASRTTNEIGQMGIQAFPFFGVGVSITLACMTVLGIPTERVAATRSTFAEKLERWLDPKEPQSILSLTSRTEKAVADMLASHNGRRRKVLIDKRTVDQVAGCYRRLERFVHVDGTFESGYTARYSETRGEKECPSDTGICTSGTCRPLQRLASPLMETNGSSQLPTFEPSGNEIVDKFNRERIAIMELQHAVAQQRLIRPQMEKLRETLLAKV